MPGGRAITSTMKSGGRGITSFLKPGAGVTTVLSKFQSEVMLLEAWKWGNGIISDARRWGELRTHTDNRLARKPLEGALGP